MMTPVRDSPEQIKVFLWRASGEFKGLDATGSCGGR